MIRDKIISIIDEGVQVSEEVIDDIDKRRKKAEANRIALAKKQKKLDKRRK